MSKLDASENLQARAVLYLLLYLCLGQLAERVLMLPLPDFAPLENHDHIIP